MTNFHKNIINPFLESSTFLIMTFPEIVESKDLLWGRTCAVDNVRARRKGIGKLYEIQISPERGLRNSLKFPSYFGMEYVRPWNMGKKLLEWYLYWYCTVCIVCMPMYALLFIIRMYACMSACLYVCMSVCVYLCASVHMCIYIYGFVWKYRIPTGRFV